MASDFALGAVLVIARILVSVVLSSAALYGGMRIFDRMTAGIDEWKEIKKGNAAVGLLLAAVMAGMMIMLQPRILDVVANIRADLPAQLVAELLILTSLNYLAGILVGTAVMFLTLSLIDRLTPDLDEMAELKGGNLAVALVYSLALVLVVFAVNVPLQDAFSLLLQAESLLL